jgi:hypothetical protein
MKQFAGMHKEQANPRQRRANVQPGNDGPFLVCKRNRRILASPNISQLGEMVGCVKQFGVPQMKQTDARNIEVPL